MWQIMLDKNSFTQFPVKNRVKVEYKHEVIYYNKCPEPPFYLRATGRRIIEKMVKS